VTEPTPSGIHDLKRIAELCRHFKIPAAVVINKSDLNPRISDEIRTWCSREGWFMTGEIPYDTAFTRSMVKGQILTEFLPSDSPLHTAIRSVWKEVERMIETKRAA